MNGDLSNQISGALFDSKQYRELLANLAAKVVRQCTTANSEATIASRFEAAVSEALRWHHVDYTPTREATVSKIVVGRVTGKRLDSRYQNIITEYKKTIDDPTLDENVQQLEEYMALVASRESQDADRYVGVLTDGRRLCFVWFEHEVYQKSPVSSLDQQVLLSLVRLFLSLSKKDLSPQNLVESFSLDGDNSPTKNLVVALYSSLMAPSEKTVMLHAEWKRLFQLASQNENNNRAIKVRKSALAHVFKVPAAHIDESKALFALQTAYTIIVKLVAYNMVSAVFFPVPQTSLPDLSSLDGTALRERLQYIEDGDVFRGLGLHNLLEGDFFSWYVYPGSWNDATYLAVLDCIRVLGAYEANHGLFQKSRVHDLFNDLYQAMIPQEVRHSLGEYYTPRWLAEHVVKNIPRPPSWRGLDPCAGSGTFVLEMIKVILDENSSESSTTCLDKILHRVCAIDINPLAVLTCRINYFNAIADFLSPEEDVSLEIPVYLGDSAFVPQSSSIGTVAMITYTVHTQQGAINFTLPKSIMREPVKTLDAVLVLEAAIVARKPDEARDTIMQLVGDEDRSLDVVQVVDTLVAQLIYLEKRDWDRIWVRIIFGFLRIATLGRFEVVVGNPPWIDWKSLPDGYRNDLKSTCVERHLFSGDKLTGGINLNICALIANVVSNNWLAPDGVLGFLMPRSILFEQSYAGFRQLVQTDGTSLRYLRLFNWSSVGYPFYPVTEKFFTYYLKKTNEAQAKTIPCTCFVRRPGYSARIPREETLDTVLAGVETHEETAFMNEGKFNNFTFERDPTIVPWLRPLAGESYYRGRVGLGLYPKELLLFSIVKKVSRTRLMVENYQGKTTQRKTALQRAFLEPDLLRPVIESPDIERFAVKAARHFAPFPYSKDNHREPLGRDVLGKVSPQLLLYYEGHRDAMRKTEYNARIQGKKGAFWSITRVGKYTFAPYHVVYRNNTKWVAAVVHSEELTAPSSLLLDHACSISTDRKGRAIGKEEAHYICALLNSSLVSRYIIGSSDSRSFKTDIPVRILQFDSSKWLHVALSVASLVAHRPQGTDTRFDSTLDYLTRRYIREELCGDKRTARDTKIERLVGVPTTATWAEVESGVLSQGN